MENKLVLTEISTSIFITSFSFFHARKVHKNPKPPLLKHINNRTWRKMTDLGIHEKWPTMRIRTMAPGFTQIAVMAPGLSFSDFST